MRFYSEYPIVLVIVFCLVGCDNQTTDNARLEAASNAVPATLAISPAAHEENSSISEDEKIWQVVADGSNLVCVTPEPFYVEWEGARLCVRPKAVDHSPHGMHHIRVYVTPEAADTMRTGNGEYPRGTVIVKKKYTDPEAKIEDFYTGMRKREPGYNPEMNDWEFFVFEPSTRMVTARGKIESCMDCHSAYEKTDFVARTYMEGNRE